MNEESARKEGSECQTNAIAQAQAELMDLLARAIAERWLATHNDQDSDAQPASQSAN